MLLLGYNYCNTCTICSVFLVVGVQLDFLIDESKNIGIFTEQLYFEHLTTERRDASNRRIRRDKVVFLARIEVRLTGWLQASTAIAGPSME